MTPTTMEPDPLLAELSAAFPQAEFTLGRNLWDGTDDIVVMHRSSQQRLLLRASRDVARLAECNFQVLDFRPEHAAWLDGVMVNELDDLLVLADRWREALGQPRPVAARPRKRPAAPPPQPLALTPPPPALLPAAPPLLPAPAAQALDDAPVVLRRRDRTAVARREPWPDLERCELLGGFDPAVAVFIDEDCMRRLNRVCDGSGRSGREIGGFLVGHWLEPDEERRGLFITDFVEGPGMGGEADYSFTAEVVDHITTRKERDPRLSQLAFLGWYHTHPRMHPFLSRPDKDFFRTFPEGHVALVVAPVCSMRRASGATVAAFFDRHGPETRRIGGFYVVPDAATPTPRRPVAWVDVSVVENPEETLDENPAFEGEVRHGASAAESPASDARPEDGEESTMPWPMADAPRARPSRPDRLRWMYTVFAGLALLFIGLVAATWMREEREGSSTNAVRDAGTIPPPVEIVERRRFISAKPGLDFLGTLQTIEVGLSPAQCPSQKLDITLYSQGSTTPLHSALMSLEVSHERCRIADTKSVWIVGSDPCGREPCVLRVKLDKCPTGRAADCQAAFPLKPSPSDDDDPAGAAMPETEIIPKPNKAVTPTKQGPAAPRKTGFIQNRPEAPQPVERPPAAPEKSVPPSEDPYPPLEPQPALIPNPAPDPGLSNSPNHPGPAAQRPIEPARP